MTMLLPVGIVGFGYGNWTGHLEHMWDAEGIVGGWCGRGLRGDKTHIMR